MRVLLALFISFLPVAAHSSPPPFKIGALIHLTGEWPAQGAAFREGIELAADEINKAGGIRGRPIELVVEDTQYKSVVAHTIGKKMLSVDHVSAAIIGTISEVMAVGPEFERAKVPLFVLWDSAPELEALGDYVFAIGPWAPS